MRTENGARSSSTTSDPMEKRSLNKIHDWLWEIPKSYRGDMRVPARVYTDEKMLDSILGDRSLDQLVNVATLPGIRKWALAMPDVHEGYGFPIGGIAAVGSDDGVISPGGIGYDINCGVRLRRSHLRRCGREGARHRARSRTRLDPHRLARTRTSNRDRFSPRHGCQHGAIRNRDSRSRARLRAVPIAGGAAIFSSDGGSRELRFCEPADQHPR